MAFDRMKALETYLHSCAHLDNFNEILEQQAVHLVKEINQMQKLEFEEGAPLLAMVQQNKMWTKALKETISQALHGKVQETMGSKGLVSNRQQLQQFIWFPLYLTKGDWDAVLKPSLPVAQKCTLVMERLWKLGLRAPNEDTQAMITVIMLLTESHRFSDSVELRSSYLAVRGLVKTFLKNHKEDGASPAKTYRDLPPCPDALDSGRRDAAFTCGETPASLPQGYTMEFLQQCMKLVPQRSNSSSISISLPKSSPYLHPGMQAAMAMGNMGMLGMGGYAQANFGHFGMGGMMFSQHAPQLAGVSMQPNAATLALPPPASSVGGSASCAAPTPCVTEKEEPKEIEVVPSSVKLTPSKRPLAITDAPAVPVPNEEKSDQVSAVQVSVALEKALEARDTEKKDKTNKKMQEEMPDTCEKDAKDSLPKEGNVQGKPAMKRPASAMTSSASTAPLKRPAASVAENKEAKKSDTTSSAGQSSKRRQPGNWKGTIDMKQRKKLRPKGCTSCRGVVGCCDSCWRKRGYRPI